MLSDKFLRKNEDIIKYLTQNPLLNTPNSLIICCFNFNI